ncbi:uncharacterized protein FTJAE_6874 [Fusarium tjaetaba]|uniref:Uncharacterized protein n=1 Tax=Fusarium tjaetaba TaxID=1567544 RepID=A0A8H5VTL8_9HYPO|nr:uncharacterized protein FTJAE_6874 [Fusarium tjaetaba]KAF5633980.1 hypothetical protein FTJAE_6874 [Fusarium tjaetaba]
MVRFIKTAFLLISVLGFTEGFMNDPPNRPPRAGKRTHRGCFGGLSDTADPVIKVKGDRTKNTWTACGQYCLAKGKPMALRKSGSERFGSYSAINTGMKSELWPDQDPSPDDPIPDCLGCTFKLPSDAVFPGEGSGVQSCRRACRYLKSKTLMMYDKQCVCTSATVSEHALDRVPEEMCSLRWARKPYGGYSYSLRAALFSVYDASEPEKPAPDATTPQGAASSTSTQTAKAALQTSGRSVGEIIEDVETEVQLQLLILEGGVWKIFAWMGRVMTKLVTPREGHEDDDRELDLQ